MKRLILLFALLTGFIAAQAQKETLPPYKQVPVIPAFTIQLTDSSLFAKKDIPKRRPVVMIYFNPECGHCQQEAQELAKNMDRFKKVFFVMAAYHDMEQIREFAVTYGLDKFSNVRIGRDTKYFIPVFYDVKMTPFSAVYNKKGNLVKAFPGGMSVDDLKKALQ
jgi:thiol-disulfide isomerase/thioredoxin